MILVNVNDWNIDVSIGLNHRTGMRIDDRRT